MRSKNEKITESNKNPELYEVLKLIEKEKGISAEYMITQIKRAIRLACKKTYNSMDEDILINMEEDTGLFEVFLNKEVVEEVEDSRKQIQLDEARKISAAARIGDKVGIRLDTKEFGRIAAQKAKNIIRQGIRDSEKGQALAEYQSKMQDIVTVTVEHIEKNEEGEPGDVTVRHQPYCLKKNRFRMKSSKRMTGSKYMSWISRMTAKSLMPLFQEHIPDLSRNCLKRKCLKYLTAQLKLNMFREKRVPERK